MAEISVRVLPSGENQLWGEFMRSAASEDTLFQSPDWLDASGRSVCTYICTENDRIVGGITVTSRAVLGAARVVMPPSLTPYMAPVFRQSSRSYTKELSQNKRIAEALARRLSKDYAGVHLVLCPNQTDVQPYLVAGYGTDVKYTYVLELGDLDRLWGCLDGARRNDIRGASRNGLRAEAATSTTSLERLLPETIPGNWKQARFRSAFHRYDDLLIRHERRRIVTVKSEAGEVVAAIYMTWDDHTAYYLLGGSVRDTGAHGATSLALWEAIQFASEELKLKRFDFEGSMVPQIERFFRKFGGTLTPYYAPHYLPRWIRAEMSARRVMKRLIGQGGWTHRESARPH